MKPVEMPSWMWRDPYQVIERIELQAAARAQREAQKHKRLDEIGLSPVTVRAMRRISGQYIPGATLCYVWDHRLPAGAEIPNAFTSRVRFVVLNSGDRQLGTWVPHEQDLVGDFLRAFAVDTNSVPPLIGVLVGADADNTGGTSLAYVGDLNLTLVPAKPQK